MYLLLNVYAALNLINSVRPEPRTRLWATLVPRYGRLRKGSLQLSQVCCIFLLQHTLFACAMSLIRVCWRLKIPAYASPAYCFLHLFSEH